MKRHFIAQPWPKAIQSGARLINIYGSHLWIVQWIAAKAELWLPPTTNLPLATNYVSLQVPLQAGADHHPQPAASVVQMIVPKPTFSFHKYSRVVLTNITATGALGHQNVWAAAEA